MTDLEVYRHMGQVTILDIILRLLGAVVVGFAVGAQRAHTSHPAGIRTHILVALGSCVVMITSCIMYTQTIELFGTSPSDPARLGAQVINGIGFLGAGAILREGFTVRGLTTAASVWVVACLGLAVGMGYYVLTALGTVVSFVTLVAFDGIQTAHPHHRPLGARPAAGMRTHGRLDGRADASGGGALRRTVRSGLQPHAAQYLSHQLSYQVPRQRT